MRWCVKAKVQNWCQKWDSNPRLHSETRNAINAVRFLLATYRTSPHPSLDWNTPAEMLHGRQPKNLLSLFLPCTSAVRKSKNKVNTKVDCSRSPKSSSSSN